VDEAITIKEIWDMTFDDSMLNTATQGGSQLKLVSLSFALFHLLRRRLFGMDCAEAGLPQTRRFALEGLLAEEDQATGFSTAFHIIEVELGFLYDFFFTNYAVLFQAENTFFFLVLLKFIFTCSLGVYLLKNSPTILTNVPIIEVSMKRVDVIVTFMISPPHVGNASGYIILHIRLGHGLTSLELYHTAAQLQTPRVHQPIS
jgi:hypothetical protein